MGYTFQGYRRADGRVGARNLVAVIPSVICANDVGQAICRQVQGTIGYFHHQGCCQLPLDLKRVTDTLSNLGQSPNVGAALIVSLIVQALLILAACFPWLVFTQSLSGVKIPYRRAMPVYTRSNLYKYLPGNVFQYVGRNQLAADVQISHVDVACATVLDVLFCVFWTCVISVLLLGGRILGLLQQYGGRFLLLGGVGGLVGSLLGA